MVRLGTRPRGRVQQLVVLLVRVRVGLGDRAELEGPRAGDGERPGADDRGVLVRRVDGAPAGRARVVRVGVRGRAVGEGQGRDYWMVKRR